MSVIFPTRLTQLKLTTFRNYARLSLETGDKSVVLTGQNGAGKTNILEAISFLSPGRGLRRAAYGDVALTSEKGGNGQWAVSTALDTEYGDVDIGTGLHTQDGEVEKTRKIRIAREPAKSSDQLLEHVRVLWLIPAMDGLFTGAAGDRRRFLDRLVLAIDPGHGTRVNAFDKAVRNRNRILEEAPHNTAWLDAAETQVAELGVAVSAARRELIAHLAAEIETTAETTETFPKATLALEGYVDALLSENNATDAEDHYLRHLNENRGRDARAGRTLDGPNRADLLVYHAQKEMPAHLCSTGEQKALLIGLVLAHARLVARLASMTPIVLLDEIAAHLDGLRRKALFDVLEDLNCQAFMTGTDPELFDELGERAARFNVAEGIVSPL